MTFGSNVAPRRRIKEKPAEWWPCKCADPNVKPLEGALCPVWHRGYLTRCDKCGTERP